MTTTTPVAAVPAGLTVRADEPDGTGLDRFSIFHTRAGLLLCGPAGFRCTAHLEQALRILTDIGVDWDREPAAVMAQLRERGLDSSSEGLHPQLRDIGLCFDPESAKARPCPAEQRPTHPEPTGGAA